MALNRRIAIPLNARIALLGINDTSVPTGGGAAPFERILDPNFDDGLTWSPTSGDWVVGSGIATNNTANVYLSTISLEADITSGTAFTSEVVVTDNPNGVTFNLQAYNSSTFAVQSLVINSDGIPGTYTDAGTFSGNFDTIRIRAIGDVGLVVSRISIIA